MNNRLQGMFSEPQRSAPNAKPEGPEEGKTCTIKYWIDPRDREAHRPAPFMQSFSTAVEATACKFATAEKWAPKMDENAEASYRIAIEAFKWAEKAGVFAKEDIAFLRRTVGDSPSEFNSKPDADRAACKAAFSAASMLQAGATLINDKKSKFSTMLALAAIVGETEPTQWIGCQLIASTHGVGIAPRTFPELSGDNSAEHDNDKNEDNPFDLGLPDSFGDPGDN